MYSVTISNKNKNGRNKIQRVKPKNYNLGFYYYTKIWADFLSPSLPGTEFYSQSTLGRSQMYIYIDNICLRFNAHDVIILYIPTYNIYTYIYYKYEVKLYVYIGSHIVIIGTYRLVHSNIIHNNI